MKIIIAYLYYNLLNFHGENGNIKILKKVLEDQGINVMVKFLAIDEEIEFEKYDLIYIGSLDSNNEEIIIKHLTKYKKEIIKAIKNKKFFLITGNTLDIFGSHIIKGHHRIKGLNIFDYYIKREDINFTDESLFTSKLISEKIIGFQKQNSLLFNNKYPLFEVIMGIGQNTLSNKEGIHYKNFYGTYLLGPLLIRNPLFFESFLKNLILSKVKNFDFKDFNLELEIEAYKTFVELHYSQYITDVNSFIS